MALARFWALALASRKERHRRGGTGTDALQGGMADHPELERLKGGPSPPRTAITRALRSLSSKP